MLGSIAIRWRRGPSRLTRLVSLALALVASAAIMVATSSIGLAEKEGHATTITAQDFKFTGVPEEIAPGTFNFTFVNLTADSPHEITFARVAGPEADDATLKQAIAAVDKRDLCPKGCFFNGLSHGAFADPSTTVPGQAHLSKGRWGYFCSITEPPGSPNAGTPHYKLGMAGFISVGDE